MIAAVQKDDALLRDIRESGRRAPEQLHAWWLGQSGFLLAHEGCHVLVDPYLSDSLTSKYAATDKPHVRMSERVIDPSRLDFIDVVTSSHHHTDHLDGDTLRPLFEVNPGLRMVLPRAWRELAAERAGVEPGDGFRLTGVTAGDSVSIGGAAFHAVTAAHNEVSHDAAGNCQFLGYVIRLGPHTVYHSGDTLLHEGLVGQIGAHGRIDLAILPINGNRPERRVAGNLDAAEAARLARDIGARLAVPCHYHMFGFNTADPAGFERECGALGQPCFVPGHGGRLSIG